jgi:hypothetical protein
MTKTTYNTLKQMKFSPARAEIRLKRIKSLKEGGVKRLTTAPLPKDKAQTLKTSWYNSLIAKSLSKKYGIMIVPIKTKPDKAHVWLIHWKKEDRFAVLTEKNKSTSNKKESIWEQLTPEQYNTTTEQLDLSSRTLNCLKRANLDMVGQIIETKQSDLLKIRNFGIGSLKEIYEKFSTMGFLPEGFTWEEPAEEKKPEPLTNSSTIPESTSRYYAEEHHAPAMDRDTEESSPSAPDPIAPSAIFASILKEKEEEDNLKRKHYTEEPNSGTIAFEYDDVPLNIPRVSAEEVAEKKKEVIAEIEEDLNTVIKEHAPEEEGFISKLKNKFK